MNLFKQYYTNVHYSINSVFIIHKFRKREFNIIKTPVDIHTALLLDGIIIKNKNHISENDLFIT